MGRDTWVRTATALEGTFYLPALRYNSGMASPGLRKGYHCAYDIHYHIHYHIHCHFVFVVRYRRALLRPEVEAELVRLSHEIGERYEIEI